MAADTAPDAATEEIAVRLMGGVTVSVGGRPAELPPSRKTRALLAFLALADRPQRRERLCEIFWEVPDDPRAALRWSLSRIRQIVGDALDAGRDAVSLRKDRLAIDVVEARRGAEPAQLSTEELERIAGLFGGGVLDDVALPRCPEYEAWRTAIASELDVAERRVLRALVDRLSPEPARALPYANRLMALDPLDGPAAAEAAALADASRRAAAGPAPARPAPASPAVPAGPRARPSAASQEVRYCAGPGGVQLAFAATGDGYPILKCANWMSDLQYDWESSIWSHWVGALSAENTLIRYDQRGNGLSDRTVDDFSFEAQLADLEAVADAACPERFALLGISSGAALSIAYAARRPERVSRLILYGGRPKGWKKSGTAIDRERRAAMVRLIRTGWGQDIPAFRQLFSSLFIPDGTPEQMDWYNELQRRTVSPASAAAIHEANGEFDVSDRLAEVTAPTLVMHASGDALVPFDSGRALAIGIPGARFISLDSRNHILLAGEPAFDRFIAEVRRFVAEAA